MLESASNQQPSIITSNSGLAKEEVLSCEGSLGKEQDYKAAKKQAPLFMTHLHVMILMAFLELIGSVSSHLLYGQSSKIFCCRGGKSPNRSSHVIWHIVVTDGFPVTVLSLHFCFLSLLQTGR